MDNMRSHHAKIVKQVLDESEIKYLYLPSYSPDLNPIEKCGQNSKHIFKERKSPSCIRTSSSNRKGIFDRSSFRLIRVVFVRAIMCGNLMDCYSCKISEVHII